MDPSQLPSLIAFDLDYTLWPFWVDAHISGPPFKVNRKGLVEDGAGYQVKFYPHVASIIYFFNTYFPDIKLAIASRTPEPVWAKAILDLLTVEPEETTLIKLFKIFNMQVPELNLPKKLPFLPMFNSVQLFPGNKIPHFKNIKKDTNIEFEGMLFFDDEPRNVRDVKTLGVNAYLVNHKGLDLNALKQALIEFRQ